MSPAEIRCYLQTLYKSNCRRQFKLALSLLLLTLARKSEWLIPAGDAKNKLPHIVYVAIEVGVSRVARTVFVVLLPFVIATKARRRRRHFGLWLILAMVLNPIVIGIAYWATVRKEMESPLQKDSTVALSLIPKDNHTAFE